MELLSAAEAEAALQQLAGEARERLLRSFAPRSKGPLRTAVRAFARFVQQYPGLQLFKRPKRFKRADALQVKSLPWSPAAARLG